MELENYNKILGSGGFGLVVKHDTEPIVAKLLYKGSCDQAAVEYNKHMEIYEAFTMIPEGYNQICLSEPLGFSNDEVVKFGNLFPCYYVMTELGNLNKITRSNHGLYHIINNEYASKFNKVVGRVYNEPVSNENPSRGFFATYDYINELISNLPVEIQGNINSAADLIERMGYMFGVMIFVAEYKPKDVEYTLCFQDGLLCLCVLDFGMIEKINFDPDVILEEQKVKKMKAIGNDIVEDILNIDIYFPVDEEGMSYFLKGFSEAFNLSTAKKKDLKRIVYNTVINNWIL